VDWAGRVELVDHVRRVPDLVGGGHGSGLKSVINKVPAYRCFRPSHRRQEPGQPGK
jgi:hypothetical protein